MIDPKQKELVTNPILWDELLELARRHDVEVLGKSDNHYDIVVRGYRPPNPGYQVSKSREEGGGTAPAGTTNLLIRIHETHPHAKPDMFWVFPHVRLATGAYPQAADNFMVAYGRNWQRFSWHMTRHNWRPHQDTLANTWLPFIDQCFSKVI